MGTIVIIFFWSKEDTVNKGHFVKRPVKSVESFRTIFYYTYQLRNPPESRNDGSLCLVQNCLRDCTYLTPGVHTNVDQSCCLPVRWQN